MRNRVYVFSSRKDEFLIKYLYETVYLVNLGAHAVVLPGISSVVQFLMIYFIKN